MTEVSLEGELLMSSLNTASEVALAREALALHGERPGGPGPLRVCVGGLGLGYTAAAALDDPRVGEVCVVELLDPPLRWMREGLVPLAERLNAEPRLRLEQGDVFARLLGPPRPDDGWDLILIDVDHSTEEPLHPSHLALYRPEGLARVRERLAPGGVLAVWSTQEDPDFLAALGATFARVERREVRWENELIDVEVVDLLFLAQR